MKKWQRKWKLSAIEQRNPHWIDLWAEIVGETTPAVVPIGTANGNAATALDSRLRGNDEGAI